MSHGLQVDALHADVVVEPHVGGHGPKVRIGSVIVGEVDHVVPDVKMGAELRPRAGTAAVVGIARARVDWVTLARRIHVAEPDRNVGLHLHALGRLFRERVCQCANEFVRIGLRCAFGQFVDEPELGGARRSVLLVHLPAIGTLAVVVPVHLGEIVLANCPGLEAIRSSIFSVTMFNTSGFVRQSCVSWRSRSPPISEKYSGCSSKEDFGLMYRN